MSLLLLEPAKQLEIIGPVPRAGEPDTDFNPASFLVTVVQTFSTYWEGDFEPGPNANAFFALAWAMALEQSQEDFISGEDWGILRALAPLVLDEAGLKPCPLPEKIYFEKMTEILRPHYKSE